MQVKKHSNENCRVETLMVKVIAVQGDVRLGHVVDVLGEKTKVAIKAA